MRSFWIWLRDRTTRVCEGGSLKDVTDYLTREDIAEADVMAVIFW